MPEEQSETIDLGNPAGIEREETGATPQPTAEVGQTAKVTSNAPAREEGKIPEPEVKVAMELTEDHQRKEELFGLYQKALDEVDWEWKNKRGEERDIGHKSITNAERAYVLAGLYDKERADKAYEAVAGRPPKPELQKRIEDMRKEDRTTAINDLTASMTSQGEKQKLLGLNLTKQQLEKQMSDWEGAIGDMGQRKRDYREKAASELIKPERPGQGDESGLDMMMRSITNGFKAGRNLRTSSMYGKKLAEVNAMVGGHAKEHGKVVDSIATFDQNKGEESPETTGIVGRARARFPGTPSIVAKAMDGIRKRMEPEAGHVTLAANEQSAQQNRSAAMAAMARQAGQGSGIGI